MVGVARGRGEEEGEGGEAGQRRRNSDGIAGFREVSGELAAVAGAGINQNDGIALSHPADARPWGVAYHHLAEASVVGLPEGCHLYTSPSPRD